MTVNIIKLGVTEKQENKSMLKAPIKSLYPSPS